VKSKHTILPRSPTNVGLAEAKGIPVHRGLAVVGGRRGAPIPTPKLDDLLAVQQRQHDVENRAVVGPVRHTVLHEVDFAPARSHDSSIEVVRDGLLERGDAIKHVAHCACVLLVEC